LPSIDGIVPAVEAAIASWDRDGQSSLRGLLSSLLEPLATTPLAALPIGNALVSLLSSALSTEAVTAFLSSFLEGLEERQTGEFGEVLVDVVEVLESEREDCEELTKREGMELDSDMPLSGGQKGLEILKLLLVRPLTVSDRLCLIDCM
jgi:hypothetical protein